jgi:hypothetical protein
MNEARVEEQVMTTTAQHERKQANPTGQRQRTSVAGPTALLIAASALFGCSSNDDSTSASGGSGSTLTLAPPLDGAGIQLKLAWTLAPGEEKTNCLVRTLPTSADGTPLYATAFAHQYTENASHHTLLYQTNLTATEVDQFPDGFAENCAGLETRRAGIYYGSQAPQGSSEMPPDVGLMIRADTTVMLEFHTINTGPDPVRVEDRMNVLWTDVAPTKQAGVFFHYDTVIHVPPTASAKAGMHCERPIDINILSVASHMHARGIGFNATLLDASGANPESLYETRDWDTPSARSFDPPLRLTKDRAIEFECHYDNSTNNEYFQGLSAIENEMCVLTGLYYADEGIPRMESNPLAALGSPEWCGGAGSYFRTYGTGACAPLRQCIDQLNSQYGLVSNVLTAPPDANHQLQRCYADSTDDASARARAYVSCRGTSCKDVCITPLPNAGPGLPIYSAECQSCLTTNCPTEIANCDAN